MRTLDYQEDRYYRHTGYAPPGGTLLATLAAWVAVALIGAAYAYVQLHVKIVDVLSFLFVAGFAAAMAFTVYAVLKWAKVRNLAVAALVAISAALLGWYMSWVAWEHALLRSGGMRVGIHQVFQRPDVVWDLARDINREGTFTLRDRPIKGIELWVAWAIEALVFLGLTVWLPIRWLRDMAFCEPCGRWCRRQEGVARLGYADEATLRERVEAKDLDYLMSLPPADSETPIHLRLDLYRCPHCPDTHLLTVTRCTVTYDKNNQRREQATTIVDRLWVDQAQAERVWSIMRERQQRWIAEADAGSMSSDGADASAAPPQAPPADQLTGLGRLALLDQEQAPPPSSSSSSTLSSNDRSVGSN